MAANVYHLEPEATPLVALMSKLGAEPATNPKVEWLENEAMPRITTLSASAASNATAFGVSADIFRVGDVVRFTSAGFAVLVTATAVGSISGTKVGGTAQASAASSAEVYLVSNANAEGSTLREIKYPQLVNASNYCQIIKTPFGLTNTEKATKHYGGPEVARLKRDHGVEHSRAIEDTFFFGARDIQATNQRLCGGLKEFISTNVTADTGGLTESDWQSFLKSGFRYGSQRKAFFGSPTALSVLEGYARANIKTSGSDDRASTYGIKMGTYVCGQGEVDLYLHRNWNDSSVYGGYGFLVDMDAVKMRPLRETRLYENVQAPDYDGEKHEYRTEIALQVIHERRHALLTGIS